uniref:Uncharacterized protein n=1 Tax=Rhizophora mucronata TaxID=61149 RepID=A0A2P2NDS7_RHIMU
MLRDVSIIS